MFERDVPEPGPSEILLRVHASSLSFHDYGVVFGGLPIEGGRIPMSDEAGEVVEVGEGVTSLTSLSNSPSETHRYGIAVLKAADRRGDTDAVHILQVGWKISISELRNHFALVDPARRSLLFAGGIGITPLLCMDEKLASTSASFGLHHCSRSAEDTPYTERIRQSTFAEAVHFYADDGPKTQKVDIVDLIAAPKPDAYLYVCGPQGFIDWALGSARDAAWSEECLHREYFNVALLESDGDKEMGFEVEIASTGATIAIAPNPTVLSALAAAGIEIPSSCQNGVCGTCLTCILHGTPDHRDMDLTPEEQAQGDQFMSCCSRSKSARLVLDL